MMNPSKCLRGTLMDKASLLWMIYSFYPVATILSMLTPLSFLAATAWGPGLGMLCGSFAYEVYSKKEEVHP